MEMERLPFGQSPDDKHRAAELKWRGMPPGLPPDRAVEFMARLKAGSTVRKLPGGGVKLGPAMVSYERFKKHCELNPTWRTEAWKISKINTSIAKGAQNRNLTHCRYGHSLANALVTYQAGYIKRDCRICASIRHKVAPPINRDVAKKVEVLLRRGASVNSFNAAGPLPRQRRRRKRNFR